MSREHAQFTILEKVNKESKNPQTQRENLSCLQSSSHKNTLTHIYVLNFIYAETTMEQEATAILSVKTIFGSNIKRFDLSSSCTFNDVVVMVGRASFFFALYNSTF